NEEAARLSGIGVAKTRIAAYAINGLCVALAALMFTAKTNNGQHSAGIGYELDAIAGAVVGGTSLLGGYGQATGTFVGSLFIVSIGVLMQLKGINTQVGMGFKGIIILIAVYLQNLGRR
ncbi:MAG TPA: ribose ABC transporter permease, partial [Fimbriimonadaceae bacterium]|nr:ribose ABC transporter permease [Fimbriimonadaceae bacterium]